MRFIARSILSLTLLATLGLPARSDETAVKRMIDEYAQAFNSHQIEDVMSFWTESGVHIDRETGERTEGRESIRSDIAAAFEQRPDTRIFGRITRLRLIKPDVASVEGEVTVSSADDPTSVNEFSAILVNQNDKWMIEEIEETPVAPPASSYDALQPLAWLVGTWVDDGEDARVETVYRWTPNQAFLLRSFAVQVPDGVTSQGTQIIGWDPRSAEIRSWTFNSDGSFGDGVWTQSGSEWLIKSSQTLADGRAASGTFVLSRVNDDEMTLKLIGHDIEGDPQPASPTVRVVRVPGADKAPAESTETE
ncbi:SgcJ/EcaC family oxidoreductase [Roseiconus nitratireducens]|uniref:SgcJ/EcaC family oxidoreductase n=1 Tax=Roseiconus nitratireducens TaxID=2605748 RepID=A0A5M6CVH7_9BACT|nr:SgcJ/EcaC family oxidoreductase [Roseiconus nitratireducens]KAA5539211.1 SgcJ/EcaC family oxidoreductase [Roseiconus nitratireducens]